ncbi:MAG: hypothetical protein IPF97_07955 [Sphingomonadales bacterium]|nr:hypothetical protein [Sphingomonadales bacterium]
MKHHKTRFAGGSAVQPDRIPIGHPVEARVRHQHRGSHHRAASHMLMGHRLPEQDGKIEATRLTSRVYQRLAQPLDRWRASLPVGAAIGAIKQLAQRDKGVMVVALSHERTS